MTTPDISDNQLDTRERQDALRRKAISPAVVYEAISQEGHEELARATSALIWSGIAAGLSMGFSFLTEALLNHHLPALPGQPLVTKLGYCVGFLIIVLGRQQLFTENTLTAVLPLLIDKSLSRLLQVARLWITVLGANLMGALVFALLLQIMVALGAEWGGELREIGAKGYAHGFGWMLLSGIFAGWLIALMVWLLPGAETARVTIIIIITYVIGLGGFAHIIAGSIAAIYMVMSGDATVADFLTRFFIPALLGNIIGGVTFVAIINHAQVQPEVPPQPERGKSAGK
jgi:formate/nitrite transporter FocA (FNT family)